MAKAATKKRTNQTTVARRSLKTAVPVVEEIAPVIGPLQAAIPDLTQFKRIVFESDPNIELCATVAKALDIDLDPDLDPRLHGMTFDRMRGFHAEEVMPVRGALVRTGSAPQLAMVADVGQYAGTISHQVQVKIVAILYPTKLGQLPRMPERAGGVLTPEQQARVIQLWDGNIPDKEAVKMFSPMKPDRFFDTVAEEIELRAVVSNTPGSNSQMLWVSWPHNVIWPCLPIRHRPRRVQEPDVDRVHAWNRRTTAERGQI